MTVKQTNQSGNQKKKSPCLANLAIKLCNFKMDLIKWQLLQVMQFQSEIILEISNGTYLGLNIHLQDIWSIKIASIKLSTIYEFYT